MKNPECACEMVARLLIGNSEPIDQESTTQIYSRLIFLTLTFKYFFKRKQKQSHCSEATTVNVNDVQKSVTNKILHLLKISLSKISTLCSYVIFREKENVKRKTTHAGNLFERATAHYADWKTLLVICSDLSLTCIFATISNKVCFSGKARADKMQLPRVIGTR